MCFSLFIVVSRALNTYGECLIANVSDALRNIDGYQITASIKSTIADSGYIISFSIL